jgi:hypothetical protein
MNKAIVAGLAAGVYGPTDFELSILGIPAINSAGRP